MARWQVTEVQRHLRGADYPATGRQLAELAKRNGAEPELVEELARIDREVPSPKVVMQELEDKLGGPTPGPRKSDQREYKDVARPAYQVKEVQQYLKGADYPMTGEQLARLAERNGAPPDLVEVLRREVGEARGPNGVMEQIKEHLGGPPGERQDQPA
jgi:hypothetical protein